MGVTFSFLFVSFLIYILYIKPIKKYDNLTSRGQFLRIIGMKKREKNLYLKYLENNDFPKHNRDIEYVLGLWYVKEKLYENATSHFYRAFIGYDKEFYYKKEFNLVIDSFLKSNKEIVAKQILKVFLDQKSFDKKFSILEQKYRNLL